MKHGEMRDITALLDAWSSGNRSAERQLWPIVYGELRRQAKRQLTKERPDHTLESGALVNETYLRLAAWKGAHFKNRTQFFAMCARMMRQILVDHARTRERQKRSGSNVRVSILDSDAIVSESNCLELLALDDAMKKLAQIHPRMSEVIELRFFGGLSVEETATVLQVSNLTVTRDSNFARAWLSAAMNGEAVDE